MDKNGRPAHVAALNGHTEIVDALIMAGRCDGKDKRGKSPADIAKDNKHPIIVAKCDPAFAKAEGEKLRRPLLRRRRCTSCRRASTSHRRRCGGVVQSEWRQEDEVCVE